MSSESITLIVNGTWASELRTRFCPTRFTYSVTTGSWISLTLDSTCWAYCLPMAICFSTPYQLPMPVLQPTFRLPTASTSSFPPCCLPFAVSAGLRGGGAVFWGGRWGRGGGKFPGFVPKPGKAAYSTYKTPANSPPTRTFIMDSLYPAPPQEDPGWIIRPPG